MNDLTFTERELVALGAALGSNCAPCVEHHISEARKAGLTDSQISAAIHLADQIRKVPAAKALNTALDLLGEKPASVEEQGSACNQAFAAFASKAAGCCS